MVVQNEPGAGGLLAVNKTFTTSPDERRLQIVNTVGAVSAQMAGTDGVQFDMLEFSPVGRIVATTSALAVPPIRRAGLPGSHRLDRTRHPPLDGTWRERLHHARCSRRDLRLRDRDGHGLPGLERGAAALLQGNGDAYVQSWDGLSDAIDTGEVNALVVASTEPVAELADVPTLADYEPVGDKR